MGGDSEKSQEDSECSIAIANQQGDAQNLGGDSGKPQEDSMQTLGYTAYTVGEFWTGHDVTLDPCSENSNESISKYFRDGGGCESGGFLTVLTEAAPLRAAAEIKMSDGDIGSFHGNLSSATGHGGSLSAEPKVPDAMQLESQAYGDDNNLSILAKAAHDVTPCGPLCQEVVHSISAAPTQYEERNDDSGGKDSGGCESGGDVTVVTEATAEIEMSDGDIDSFPGNLSSATGHGGSLSAEPNVLQAMQLESQACGDDKNLLLVANAAQEVETDTSVRRQGGASHCSMCGEKSKHCFRTCPKCGKDICLVCATVTDQLFEAVKPFLKGDPDAAWQELCCLDCQSVEKNDELLHKCFNDVQKATENSLGQFKHMTAQCKSLWHQVGLAFVDGGPSSGFAFSVGFRDSVEKLVILETELKGHKPSVAPWDAELVNFSSYLILEVAKCYSKKFKLPGKPVLKEIGDSKLRIIVVSADIGHHPASHCLSSELIAMSKYDMADVTLVCVATRARRAILEQCNSPYRAALKDAFGHRFLQLGDLSDKQINAAIKQRDPHIVYLVGCHQDGDRMGVLEGVNAVIVQGVGHASTSGASGVHHVLCNDFVLSDEQRRFFSERPLFIEGPFLPNSYGLFFKNKIDHLQKLRKNVTVRSQERSRRNMPSGKIIVNISKPNRLNQDFLSIVFRVLKANSDTFVVLIDHGFPAFQRRIESICNQQGLSGRIVFMPFQDLHTGELHEVLALADLGLDTPGYNSHTAGHDVLWANGVFVSVKGERLASRIGAELLHWFGTPENICDSLDAAVDRVNTLLQNPELLAQAHARADQCRTESSIYDHELRARMVIEALLRAYNDMLLSESRLSDDDIDSLANALDGLGIAVEGTADRNQPVVMMPATFRGVSVDVKISKQREPCFLELLAREWRDSEYGLQMWARLFPLFENRAYEPGADTELDVIQLACLEKKVYAVIEERHSLLAGVLLDALAEEWKQGLSQSLVNRTAVFLLAVVKLLKPVHARGRAYGADPRGLKLSLLRDGYGKEAAAHVEYGGQAYSVLLGSAESLMDPFAPHVHRPNCKAEPGRKLEGETSRRLGRSVKAMVSAQKGRMQRTSARIVAGNAAVSADEVRSTFLLSSPCTCSCIKMAKRDDLRRAALAVVNAILGTTGTNVADGHWDGCTHFDLLRQWLQRISDNEFIGVTGLLSRTSVDDSMCAHMLRKIPHLSALFELLSSMLGSAPLEAADIFPFPGMILPSNAYPEGLNSVPEALRAGMRQSAVLTTEPSPKTQHYFVAGGTFGRGQKRLIATWLVVSWKEERKRFYRSVVAAENGKNGDIAAIYQTRVVLSDALITYLNPCHFMKFPNFPGKAPAFDGKPRACDAVPTAVAESRVGHFVNSSLDRNGDSIRSPNCVRDWNPDWGTYGSARTVTAPPSDIAMGVRLITSVRPYDEILYAYPWGKSEKESSQASHRTNHLAELTRTGASSVGHR